MAEEFSTSYCNQLLKHIYIVLLHIKHSFNQNNRKGKNTQSFKFLMIND